MYLLSAGEVENWLGDELDFKLSFVDGELLFLARGIVIVW